MKIPTEIYSRVSGYFRPVSNWNKAKKEEFLERRDLQFDLSVVNKEALLTPK